MLLSDYPDLNGITRTGTLGLLEHWVESASLRRHCLAVETAMRAYANHFGESEEAWGLVGLIHDFDYERHPTLDEHPMVGAAELGKLGYPDWFVRAVLSHADDPSYPRESKLEKTLFAVDELTGFVSAVALVRPSKAIADVKASSVKKKMKDKGFAAAVHREDLIAGADELGIPLDDHITFVIDAMSANAEAPGLGGIHLKS